MVVVLMGIAGTLALVGLRGYGATQDHQGSANELVSDLRNAGQRAVTEGRTYCVHVDDANDQWSVYRKSCTTGTLVAGPDQPRGDITLGGLSLAATAAGTCPTTGTCIYFHPRGTATGGPTLPNRAEIQVQGPDSNITVTVEGLTGRVDRT